MTGWGRRPHHWKEHCRGPGPAFHVGKSSCSHSTRARLGTPHGTAGSFPTQHSAGASWLSSSTNRTVTHVGIGCKRYTFLELLYHNRHHSIQLYRCHPLQKRDHLSVEENPLQESLFDDKALWPVTRTLRNKIRNHHRRIKWDSV